MSEVMNRTNPWTQVRTIVVGTVAALLLGFPAADLAHAGEKLWSVAVHLAYIDGSEYDVIFAHGVPTNELPAMLESCGRSHQGGAGSTLQFHCYPIPE